MNNGIKISFTTDAMIIDLRPFIMLNIPNVNFDRKYVKIKINDIRSATMNNNDSEVQIVFSNGEIQTMNFAYIDTIDGATVANQQEFFDKIDAKIFT